MVRDRRRMGPWDATEDDSQSGLESTIADSSRRWSSAAGHTEALSGFSKTAQAQRRPSSWARPSVGGGSSDEGVVELVPGQRVFQYELIRSLGRGGMGEVFLARDTRLGRRVAIKFLHRTDSNFLRRFWIEAKATAQCTHEHIVVIHEVNEYQGRPFMVLEYVEGDTLKQVVSRGPLPWPRAVEIATSVVEALVRAHELGIVHRDLKPANIVVQKNGVVKVLDFGIAKLFRDPVEALAEDEVTTGDIPAGQTLQGALVGTVAYMSPEQAASRPVGPQTDIWAVGVILYEMLVGKRPLAGLKSRQILDFLLDPELLMPAVGQAVPGLPERLDQIVDRCLAKEPEDRYQSARQLLEDLVSLSGQRQVPAPLASQEPFPGLVAFQESDSGRFFGRRADVRRVVARIREQPLVAVVGASGVGKSSLVRAGVVPELKGSGEKWEILSFRPGRDPIGFLARLLEPMAPTATGHVGPLPPDQESLAERIRREPGLPGALLRSRARHQREQILVFVDQFEELFTLGRDPAERALFMDCLIGMADDVSAPIRVVLSLRSDFLDRAAEHGEFIETLTRGLVFLQEPDREGLREALTQPVHLAGYRFEDPALVERILDALERTSGALPMLQFAGAKLWAARDTDRKILTWAAYEAMGGVEGALASHANEVLSALPPGTQDLVRRIFLSLVTSEGTRAQKSVPELVELLNAPGQVERIVDHLVAERLLVVHSQGHEGAVVEIVHESLIQSWPTLKRWIDESGEDTAFLEQLRNTARQWATKGRPQGLLWRGEAMEEARRWYDRYQGTLPPLEAEYLQAVFRLAERSRRLRRMALAGSFLFLLSLVAAAGVTLVLIRNAERRQREQARIARREAARARAAEERIKRQIELLKAKEREKRLAQEKALRAKQALEEKQEKLKSAQLELNLSYDELRRLAKKLLSEKQRAEAEARRARQASEKAKRLAEKQKAISARLQALVREKNRQIKKLKARLSSMVQKLR